MHPLRLLSDIPQSRTGDQPGVPALTLVGAIRPVRSRHSLDVAPLKGVHSQRAEQRPNWDCAAESGKLRFARALDDVDRPPSALGERFTRRPRPRIAASSAPTSATPTTARPDVRRHARRPRTRAETELRPRSTPHGACFMTSPDVARTSVACEVKLYLAIPSPSSSSPSPPCLIARSSPVRRRARPGLAGAPLGSHGPRPRPTRPSQCPEATARSCEGRTVGGDRARGRGSSGARDEDLRGTSPMSRLGRG